MASGIKCTFEGCDQHFDSEKDMKRHKYAEDTHHYCKRCDYDAEDWNDLLRHKVEAMAPFLLQTVKRERGQKLPHIVCEFCGDEYKTWEGRDQHRNRVHEKPQIIRCLGNGPVWDEATKTYQHSVCDQLFESPSGLIEHYERNQCLFISQRHFLAEQQQKHIVKQIMNDPDFFTGSLRDSKALKERKQNFDWNEDEVEEDTFGGVKLGEDLFSVADASQTSGAPPLAPRITAPNIMDQDGPPIARKTHEMWPLSPTVDSKQSLSSRMGEVALSDTKTTSRTAFPTSSGRSESSYHTANGNDSAMNGLQSTAGGRPNTGSGTKRTTWQSLTIPDSCPSPTPSESASNVDWAGIRAAKIYNKTEEVRTNLFHARWWDPSSEDYTPDLFWHTLLEIYKCPFARCDAHFKHQYDMEMHLRETHIMKVNKCPTCVKRFDTVAGLVRHFEASGRDQAKCRIARASDYPQVLDEVTGGFLFAKKVKMAKLVGYKSAGKQLVRFRQGDESVEGVTKTKYEAALPDGVKVRAEDTWAGAPMSPKPAQKPR